jgi:hypothetical protein
MKKLTYSIVLISILSFFAASAYSQDIRTLQQNTAACNYDVLIYPNPVTDDNFSVKSDNLIKTVEILNVIGQSVKKITNETGVPYNIIVKMPDCEKGMYMVRIIFADNKSQIKKVLFK